MAHVSWKKHATNVKTGVPIYKSDDSRGMFACRGRIFMSVGKAAQESADHGNAAGELVLLELCGSRRENLLMFLPDGAFVMKGSLSDLEERAKGIARALPTYSPQQIQERTAAYLKSVDAEARARKKGQEDREASLAAARAKISDKWGSW